MTDPDIAAANSSRGKPRGIRPLAMVIGTAISTVGGLALLARYDWARAAPGQIDPGAAWAFVQFVAGAWAGVTGAGSPLVHGLVAGVPALLLGLIWGHTVPNHLHVVGYCVAPAAAILAAGVMRYSVRQASSR
mgnify:FL=1